MGKPIVERGELLTELGGIAVVEILALVELGVALARRVRPHAVDPRELGVGAGEGLGKVIRVGAVDHVIERRVTGGGVDRGNRLAQRHAGRQRAVGLDGERDHHGNVRGPGRTA